MVANATVAHAAVAHAAVRKRPLSLRRGWFAALTLAALVGWGDDAMAHGRFPQAGQVVVDPSDPDRLFVRTTYGATTTSDRGASWSWICPESIGFNAEGEDPSVVILGDGTTVVAAFGGLSVSHDAGCNFVPEAGDLEPAHFADVQAMGDPSRAMALSSNGLDSFEFVVKLWETADSGGTWTQVGNAPPSHMLALSLGLAWSDPNRLYLTGRDGMTEEEKEGAIYRSDDRGNTWMRVPVPNAKASSPDIQILPFIGGVAFDDPDTVFVGVVTTQANVVTHFELLVSTDGGAAFTSIFEADDAVTGFALSPDGDTVAIGGPKQGLWTAPTSTLAFTKINELRVGCLTWDKSGLFACADEFVDGYTLGVSDDEGKTFTPLARLGSPCGPPGCPADTSTAAECESLWPQEQKELNAFNCDGAGGAGEGGGGAVPPSASSGSCGCRIPAASEEPQSEGGRIALLFGALLGIAGIGARRASKRRR
jgi:hypothetical protein